MLRRLGIACDSFINDRIKKRRTLAVIKAKIRALAATQHFLNLVCDGRRKKSSKVRCY